MAQKFVHFDMWGDVPIKLDLPIVYDVFTRGNCGALAYAVNLLTGWEIITSYSHAANLTPIGKVLDIKGLHDLELFEKEWNKTKLTSKNSSSLRDYGVNEWRAALPFAKLLLQKYFPKYMRQQLKERNITS